MLKKKTYTLCMWTYLDGNGNALPRNINVLYYSYTTGNLPPFNASWKKSLCSLRPLSASHFIWTVFAVNLVRKTDAARAVYAAITSCVDIALAHYVKSLTLYHTHRNTRGISCFCLIWQETLSLPLLQRHLITVNGELSVYSQRGKFTRRKWDKVQDPYTW